MPSFDESGATSRIDPPSDWRTAALLIDSGDDRATKWGTGPQGAGATLTYSFPDGNSPFVPDYPRGYPDHLIPLTPAQQEAAEQALKAWSAVADIDLREVAESASEVGDIRLAAASTVPPYALAYPPDDWPGAGDVWLDDSLDGYAVTPDGIASHGYGTILHELGHAVFGLEDVSKISLDGTIYDDPKYTVMSYEPDTAPEVDGRPIDRPTTPMLLDIAAAQYLYGPNLAHNAGDTVYRWDEGERIFETIWDGGGRDTIDWSNQATDARINLNAGKFSELGPPVRKGTGEADPETLAIAYDVVIEDATGGAGGDELIGNPHANTLCGGDGDDELKGGAGGDMLQGDAGDDVLAGGGGGDAFVFAPGCGIDRITDFEAGAGGGDVIDLIAFGLGGFDALLASAVDEGGGAVIELAAGDIVLLEGIAVAELQADDFWL